MWLGTFIIFPVLNSTYNYFFSTNSITLQQVFALGTNCSGCLGIGDTQSCIEPRRLDILCGKKLTCLSYGSGPHVVAATVGMLHVFKYGCTWREQRGARVWLVLCKSGISAGLCLLLQICKCWKWRKVCIFIGAPLREGRGKVSHIGVFSRSDGGNPKPKLAILSTLRLFASCRRRPLQSCRVG